MDILINSLDKLQIHNLRLFNESHILINIIYHRDMLIETEMRYIRYLEAIDEWKINETPCDYIRVEICLFLELAKTIYKRDSFQMLRHIRCIDDELIRIT